DDRLEWGDHVADHVFWRIVQQGHQALLRARFRHEAAEDVLDKDRVLRDGEGVVALCLPVPACNARKPMRDVGYLDIERGRIEQVQTAAGEHALPGARWSQGLVGHYASPGSDLPSGKV